MKLPVRMDCRIKSGNDDYERKKEAERRQTCSSNLRTPTFILPRLRGRMKVGARRVPLSLSPPPLAGEG